MDILKARKKAREDRETQSDAAAALRGDDERTEEGPPVMVTQSGAHSVGSRSHSRERPLQIDEQTWVERKNDPLGEFLARYDAGAQEDEIESEDVDERSRYITFRVQDEQYAVSIMSIAEILRVVSLTPVPRAPPELLGVLSKRGVVMPVVDLGATLGLRAVDRRFSNEQRIFVIGSGEKVCGLRVDQMQDIVRLSEEDIEEVPASLGAKSAHLLRGIGRVGERMMIVLDVESVLRSMAAQAGLVSDEVAL